MTLEEFDNNVPVPLHLKADENAGVQAMTGGTWDHHAIISNAGAVLRARKLDERRMLPAVREVWLFDSTRPWGRSIGGSRAAGS